MSSNLEELASGNLDLTPPDKREQKRQRDAEDDHYLRSFLYIFELVFPTDALEDGQRTKSPTTSMLFPLVINPTGYSMTEPFALAVTPGADGGLFAEENGVLARTIHIVGTTGFRPKRQDAMSTNLSAAEHVQDAAAFSYAVRGKAYAGELSGQRHFQFLQDRVFRFYGELKRTQRFAFGTRMIFHNLKENESFRVLPVQFALTKSKDSRNLYHYSIELLAVERADAPTEPTRVRAATWLTTIVDTANAIKEAYDDARATLDEVVKLAQEIEQFVSGVISVIDGISDFFDAVGDFISGVVSVILTPIEAVSTILGELDAVLDAIEAIPEKVRATVAHTFRRLEDNILQVAAHKSAFVTPTSAKIDSLNRTLSASTASARADRVAAAAVPATTMRQYANRGSAPLPGDEARARSARGVAPGPKYTSAFARVVGATDTLESLAAAYIGDANEWRAIALLNGLSAPYISSTASVPNTVRAGDTLLIPSRRGLDVATPDTGVFGVANDATPEVRALGTDLALSATTGGLYDLTLSADSHDFSVVAGVGNLSQAIRTRLETERGTDPVFPDLGVERVVGLGLRAVDREFVRLRARMAVAADPRVSRVTDITLASAFNAQDAVPVELTASVRGLSRSVTIETGD